MPNVFWWETALMRTLATVAVLALAVWLAAVLAATTYQPPTLVWTLTPATEVF